MSGLEQDSKGWLKVTEDLKVRAFSDEEYRLRHSAVREHFDEHGIEALLVTVPAHVAYLSGDSTGMQRTGVPLAFTPVIITRDRSEMLIRIFEAESAAIASPLDEIVPFSADLFDPIDPPLFLARRLQELGLGSSAIGYEGDGWGMTPGDLSTLSGSLPKAKMVDVGGIVARIGEIKSEEEIALMREVSQMTVAGYRAFVEALAVGKTEAEVAAETMAALIRSGSEWPYYHPFVISGARSRLPHAIWSDRKIESGDPVFLELSGSRLRYHSAIVRTAVVGQNEFAAELYGLARAAQESSIAAIRPGALTGEVDKACRAPLVEAGRLATLKNRCGYAIGIDWTARKALSLRPGGEDVLVEGMTFHMPTILYDGGIGVGCSETVVVTADGCESLSGDNRELPFITA